MRAIWLVCFWFLSFQSEAALSQQLAPSTPGSTPEKSQPETPPKAASVPPQPSGTVSPTVSVPNGPIILNLPNPIKIETNSQKGSEGSSGSGWLTFFGVLITAGVSGWVGYQVSKGGQAQRDLTAQLTTKEQQIRIELAGLELRLKKDQFDREQKEKRAQADRSHNYAQEIDGIKLSIEERRIAAELERLGFQNTSSGIDSYISISRFVNEKQDAEVKILQSFSDRLLGDTAKERLYALLIISAYVSPEVIKRLAAGGEEIIPTESLKILEKTEDYEISEVAKDIINRRSTARNPTSSTVKS